MFLVDPRTRIFYNLVRSAFRSRHRSCLRCSKRSSCCFWTKQVCMCAFICQGRLHAARKNEYSLAELLLCRLARAIHTRCMHTLRQATIIAGMTRTRWRLLAITSIGPAGRTSISAAREAGAGPATLELSTILLSASSMDLCWIPATESTALAATGRPHGIGTPGPAAQ